MKIHFKHVKLFAWATIAVVFTLNSGLFVLANIRGLNFVNSILAEHSATLIIIESMGAVTGALVPVLMLE